MSLVNAIGGLFGLDGGQNGTGVAAPVAAPIVQPTNTAQIGTAYNGAQNSLQSQQALLAALQAQNGIGNQSQVYGQLQGVANGTGPNPAEAMLNQATGQNNAAQAALMAGQRGVGSNPGLIARQAAQQGSANQQNAIGQGATLQAQQSLNALGQAGNMANTQAGQQIAATGANTSAQLGEQQNLLGAQANANNAAVSAQNSVNSVNGTLANTGLQGQQKAIGGLFGGLGSALSLAHGGQVGGPKSFAGRHLAMAKGGKVQDVMVSPGEIYLTPQKAREVANNKSKAPEVIGSAKKIPGKAPVKGDSLKNDIVPAKLERGGVVVPRSKANIPADAAKFIEAVFSKKGKK